MSAKILLGKSFSRLLLLGTTVRISKNLVLQPLISGGWWILIYGKPHIMIETRMIQRIYGRQKSVNNRN